MPDTLMRTREPDLAGLVEADRVHKRVYTDPAVFELEMERIWGKAWIYVGHESQVPNTGDFYHTTIGKHAVLMVRQKDGGIAVLFNRCAHKGAQLVGEESGNVKQFRCGYHGWCFALDGKFKGAPMFSDGYSETRLNRDSADMHVHQLPRYGAYRGFVFASLDPNAPELETWLGGVASTLDNMVDRSPEQALEATGGVMRYVHNSNWKFFVENLNDLMHSMVVHESASMTARKFGQEIVGAEDTRPAAIQILEPFSNDYAFFDEMGLRAFDYGHGYSGGNTSIHAGYSEIPGYFEQLEQTHGREKAKEILSMSRHNTVVWPSMTLKGAVQTLRVVKPLAVDKTLIESWTFRLKGAPDALLHRSIYYCNLINSAFNLVGPDDEELYKRQQRGLETEGGEWVSLHRNLGDVHPEGHGYVSRGTSDMAFRNMFRAWRHYMLGTAADEPLR